jgi:hypothetical protein
LQQFTFSQYDRRVLEKQPEYVQYLFPMVLSHRSGLDSTLLSMARRLVTAGVYLHFSP